MNFVFINISDCGNSIQEVFAKLRLYFGCDGKKYIDTLNERLGNNSFENFIKCIKNGDIKCQSKIVIQIGVVIFETLAKKTNGELSELLQHIGDIDKRLAKNLDTLSPGDKAEAQRMSCNVMNYKVEVLNNYYKKHPKN